ncbi:alpha/beta fold hydrolase [Desulforapulum autotrophicum]|uniref:alpha/beta fold hydrolase n=1 Tax=Desulforapulum autotrophicum TaxID=2296 RepID=UPI001E505188|nr:alpha/beta fold hydrolase [Desulforapulum autotrophicum]
MILTHGTFSNALICAKIAEFLNDNGFECWIYEWVGHGRSKYGALYPDVEDFAINDVPAVVQAILAKTDKPSCIWVAHSGGGFLPLIYMARNVHQQHKIEAIVGLGSQTSGAGKTWTGKLATRIVPMIIGMIGKVPGPLFGLGPEDEISGFLRQWCQWNRSGQWIGKDGFNYYNAMKQIQIPTLLIAGGSDSIAPPNGCQQLLQSLGSTRKKFVLCSKARGYMEDYNHPRLIASRNSKTEIWPVVLEFIR